MTSSVPGAAPARRAVVAGHGDFAAGLISAVQQITGRGDAFLAVSNRDLGALALEEALRATVNAHAAAVIFTDLPAGSCTIAARRVAHDTPGVAVVTGTNLSVLLGWLLGPGDGAVSCDGAAERGRAAIAVLHGPVPAEGGSAH
jgi:PTS system N-acetylgalactosamine-specific IIA component